MGSRPLFHPYRRKVRPDHIPLWRQLSGPARRPRPADPVLQRGDASSTPPTARGHCPPGDGADARPALHDRAPVGAANGERLFDNAPFVRPIPGLPLLTAAPLKNSDTFRELTWRASLDRHITDELMGYVSVSRGFQSGGWNLQTRESRVRAGTARRLRGGAEIRRSDSPIPGGREHLLL